MCILLVTENEFPFQWVNLDFYPDSLAQKNEIYIEEYVDLIDAEIEMFNELFNELNECLGVFYNSWWDFCLDTWNPVKDDYDYSLEDKSIETIDYLTMLKTSNINNGYAGCCKCLDWNVFLKNILRCINSHRAPFSPIFYSKEYDFFFYFHHTGSIGFYYKFENDVVKTILKKACKRYLVK